MRDQGLELQRLGAALGLQLRSLLADDPSQVTVHLHASVDGLGFDAGKEIEGILPIFADRLETDVAILAARPGIGDTGLMGPNAVHRLQITSREGLEPVSKRAARVQADHNSVVSLVRVTKF